MELGVGDKDPDRLKVKAGDCRFCWGTGRVKVKEEIQTKDSVCSACRGTGKEAL